MSENKENSDDRSRNCRRRCFNEMSNVGVTSEALVIAGELGVEEKNSAAVTIAPEPTSVKKTKITPLTSSYEVKGENISISDTLVSTASKRQPRSPQSIEDVIVKLMELSKLDPDASNAAASAAAGVIEYYAHNRLELSVGKAKKSLTTAIKPVTETSAVAVQANFGEEAAVDETPKKRVRESCQVTIDRKNVCYGIANDLVPVVTSFMGDFTKSLEKRLEVAMKLMTFITSEGTEPYETSDVLLRCSLKNALKTKGDKSNDIFVVPFPKDHNGHENRCEMPLKDLDEIKVYVGGVQAAYRYWDSSSDGNENDRLFFYLREEVPKKRDSKAIMIPIRLFLFDIYDSFYNEAVEGFYAQIGPVPMSKFEEFELTPRKSENIFEFAREKFSDEFENGSLKIVFDSVQFNVNALPDVTETLRELESFKKNI